MVKKCRIISLETNLILYSNYFNINKYFFLWVNIFYFLLIEINKIIFLDTLTKQNNNIFSDVSIDSLIYFIIKRTLFPVLYPRFFPGKGGKHIVWGTITTNLRRRNRSPEEPRASSSFLLDKTLTNSMRASAWYSIALQNFQRGNVNIEKLSTRNNHRINYIY
jgi:hypothetical protein